jgi:CheY-like chemotaxis protein
MTARVEFEANARSLTSPVLSPRVPLASGAGDHPVVLIAHGLRRAYLVADQLIWKLPADPVEMAPDPRVPELAGSVRTDDGETFRVADPAILLAEVAPIPVPDLDVRGTEAGAEAGASKAEPIPSATPATVASSPSRSVHSAPAPQLAVIEPERVTPLPLRALIADDSISTRLYLARQLEPTGFEVRSVATAAELMRELDAGSWSVAFVDVDLPDARGREFLENVRARARARGVEVVALVRDGAEVRMSGEAGVTHSLSKPLEREVLKLLMNQLGFGTGEG